MKMWGNKTPDTMESYFKHYGDISFAEAPLNDVDSLLLCQLSYLKFDGLVPGVKDQKAFVTLTELAAHPDRENIFTDIFFEEENRALFEGMLSCRRFRSIRMNCYVNMIEKEWETQFSAITFLLEDGSVYVAFRGTDESIVGWKEDLNMAFLAPVPGQELSAKYLNMVSKRFPNSFYVGGHSKGGNLAVYGAMYCASDVRRRILKVYNMDGPGFRPEILQAGAYEAIADRVVKFLPHSSVVGMLLGGDENYQVVESRSFGLAQHNPFNWKIRNGDFVYVDDIYAHIHLTDDTLNEWIMSMDEEQIRLFVDTLYQVIQSAQTDNLIGIASDWKNSVNKVRAALKDVDSETRKALQETVKSLFGMAVSRAREGRGRQKFSLRQNGTEEVSRTGWSLRNPGAQGATAPPKWEGLHERSPRDNYLHRNIE